MRENVPIRKNLRLKDYDYSQPGYYFVTICTAVRNKNILCRIDSVGGGLCAAPQTTLTRLGNIVEKAILDIPRVNPGVEVDIYCIMPDHIHLVVVLTGRHGDRPLHAVIGQMKSFTQAQYRASGFPFGKSLWQRNFYEHIIRNDADLSEIRQYIQYNPQKVPFDLD